MIEPLAPYLLDELLREAMDGALRTCVFWRLPTRIQMLLLAASLPSDLSRWQTGDLAGTSVRTWEGVCRLLVCAEYVVSGEEPDQLYRIIRARIDAAPFDGESLLDFLISSDAARHQDLLEYISGHREPLDVRRLISRQHHILRSHFWLLPSRPTDA